MASCRLECWRPEVVVFDFVVPALDHVLARCASGRMPEEVLAEGQVGRMFEFNPVRGGNIIRALLGKLRDLQCLLKSIDN